MFDIANLEHLAENKAADEKIAKLRAEYEKNLAAVAEAKLKIRQAENKITRLKNLYSKETRKARNHRLIQRGAIAEKFIPDAENVTNDEFKDALTQSFSGTR